MEVEMASVRRGSQLSTFIMGLVSAAFHQTTISAIEESSVKISVTFVQHQPTTQPDQTSLTCPIVDVRVQVYGLPFPQEFAKQIALLKNPITLEFLGNLRVITRNGDTQVGEYEFQYDSNTQKIQAYTTESTQQWSEFAGHEWICSVQAPVQKVFDEVSQFAVNQWLHGNEIGFCFLMHHFEDGIALLKKFTLPESESWLIPAPDFIERTVQSKIEIEVRLWKDPNWLTCDSGTYFLPLCVVDGIPYDHFIGETNLFNKSTFTKHFSFESKETVVSMFGGQFTRKGFAIKEKSNFKQINSGLCILFIVTTGNSRFFH